MSDLPATQASASETWQEIAGVIDELAELAKEDVAPERFEGELLERAVRATAAVGGALWACPDGSPPRVTQQLGLASTLLGADALGDSRWRQTVAESAQRQEQVLIPPVALSDDGSAGQAANGFLLLQPIKLGDEVLGVVQLVHSSDRSPAFVRSSQRVLEIIGELASDFYRQRRLRELSDRERGQRARDEFILRLLRRLDLEDLAYTMANEGRRLIGCDRVSVLTSRGGSCRVRSISGIDTIERRSSVVRGLEQLASRVVQRRQPLWYEAGDGEPPEELREYLAESQPQRLGVVPLTIGDTAAAAGGDRVVGALIVEDFGVQAEPTAWQAVRQRVGWVAAVSAGALHNAQRAASMPWARMLGMWDDASPRRKWRWLILPLLLAAAGAVMCVPVQFYVPARGELQPQEQQIIYAPADGVVISFPALVAAAPEASGSRDALRVRQAETVLELQSAALDVELAALLGERETKQQQLESLSVTPERLNRATTAMELAALDELAARKLELSLELESLVKRLAILEQEKDRLSIKARIDGHVQTWDAEELLRSRPVRQGQRLMTIANLDGPWRLDLYVEDRHVGHLAAARSRLHPELPVSFLYKSAPERTYEGRLQHLALSTEVVEDYGPSVLATVQIGRDQLAEPRPGATVVAKIHCGKKPLGYVWLHDVWEAIRTRLLF